MFKDSFIKRVKTQLEQGEKHSDGAAPPETGKPYVLPPPNPDQSSAEKIRRREKTLRTQKSCINLHLGRQIA